MKEHYYSNFKGCLGPCRPRTARSSPFRWISRFHLSTPFGLRSPAPAHIRPILVYLNSKYDDWWAYRRDSSLSVVSFICTNNASYFNGKRIVSFSRTSIIKSSMLIFIFRWDKFWKIKREKKTKMFVNVLRKIERTLGISITSHRGACFLSLSPPSRPLAELFVRFFVCLFSLPPLPRLHG